MSTRLRALAFVAAVAAFGGISSVGACPAPEFTIEGKEGQPSTFATKELPVTITVAGTGWTCAGENAGCGGGGGAEKAYDEVVLSVSPQEDEESAEELARVEPNDDDGTFSADVTLDALEPGIYSLIARATDEGFTHRVPIRIR